SMSFGVRMVAASDILAGLAGQDDTLAQAAVVKRVPRTVLAAMIGVALGMSGAAMQAVTRNPIADPGILGVTSGASLAVVIGLAFFGVSGAWGQIAVAVAGAAVPAVVVYIGGSLGRGGATRLQPTPAGAARSAAFVSRRRARLLPRGGRLPAWQPREI